MPEKADGGMTRYCATAPVCFLHWGVKLEKWLAGGKRYLRYVASLVFAVAIFALFYSMRAEHKMYFEIVSVTFAIVVVLLTMKFRASNRVYTFIGQNLFSFYIYQRIPMILLKDSCIYWSVLF